MQIARSRYAKGAAGSCVWALGPGPWTLGRLEAPASHEFNLKSRKRVYADAVKSN